MTFSKIGRIVTALVASAALGLGMTACGGGTIGYMWVLGTYYNQITGYKIDDFTGNLTIVEHSPFGSGGSSPQMLAVKPGGRFLYVVNSGIGQVGVPGQTGYMGPTGSSIQVFSIGGGGILTPQTSYSSQGTHPIYITFDSSGNFLYVLDQYGPNYCASIPCGTNAAGQQLTSVNTNGSITAFSIAADTGRLTLVTNTTVLNPNQTPTTFFEVGANPIMSRVGSGSCLYTLTANAVYPYVISTTSGQLTLPSTGPQQITGAVSLTSINTSAGTSAGSYVFLTDGGANQIYSMQASTTACSLSPVPQSQSANVVSNVIPVNSLTTANGKFLYVINQFNTATGGNQGTGNSSISAFTIDSQGRLASLTTDGTNNPYATGSGPECIVEDPSSQYIYTSNNTDSTVTGKQLDQNRGRLSDLLHGSTFPAAQQPTCLVVSGNI